MKLKAQKNFEDNAVVNWNNLVYGKENRLKENEKAKEVSDDENDFFRVIFNQTCILKLAKI